MSEVSILELELQEGTKKPLGVMLHETGKRLDTALGEVDFLNLALLRAFDNDKSKVRDHIKSTREFMFRDLNKG